MNVHLLSYKITGNFAFTSYYFATNFKEKISNNCIHSVNQIKNKMLLFVYLEERLICNINSIEIFLNFLL